MKSIMILDTLRAEIATLEAEKAAAVAKTERLESELARYQRADVPERVRTLEHLHAGDPIDRPGESPACHCPCTKALRNRYEDRGELLAIVRQQQVRIGEQAAEIERLKSASSELVASIKQHLEWSRGCVAEDIMRILIEHETSLRAHEGDTDKVPRVEAVGNDSLPLDNRPLLEPLEELKELPDPAKGDEFRPGLPPLALRMARKEWEVDGDGRLSFYTNERGRECFKEVGPSGAAWIATVADADFSGIRLRPLGKRWSDVEQEAARAIGAEDAKARRAYQDRESLSRSILGKPPTSGWDVVLADLYRAAYDAAKGG